MSGFKKATKASARLRLALIGPPGSGKTYTGIGLACCLGKRVAVVDTEQGSASKYADLFDFDVLEMSGSFHPQRYVEAIQDAAKAGYEVVVIDSLSHAWIGAEGGLDLHDKAVARQKVQNKWTAWAEVTPHHMALVTAIVQAPLHVIATMRSKVEYVLDEKNRPQKVGTAPLMRDGVEYEFDVVADMTADNTLLVTKSRCPALSGAVIKKPGRGLAETLTVWLRGAPAEPAATAEPEPTPTPTPTPTPPARPSPAPAPAPAPAEPVHVNDEAEARRLVPAIDAALRAKDKLWLAALRFAGVNRLKDDWPEPVDARAATDVVLDMMAGGVVTIYQLQRLAKELAPKGKKAPGSQPAA